MTDRERLREPLTEAGRALLDSWARARTHPPSVQRHNHYVDMILAIEQPLVADLAAAEERVRVLVKGHEAQHRRPAGVSRGCAICDAIEATALAATEDKS